MITDKFKDKEMALNSGKIRMGISLLNRMTQMMMDWIAVRMMILMATMI